MLANDGEFADQLAPFIKMVKHKRFNLDAAVDRSQPLATPHEY
jgi:hypothetical protein